MQPKYKVWHLFFGAHFYFLCVPQALWAHIRVKKIFGIWIFQRVLIKREASSILATSHVGSQKSQCRNSVRGEATQQLFRFPTGVNNSRQHVQLSWENYTTWIHSEAWETLYSQSSWKTALLECVIPLMANYNIFRGENRDLKLILDYLLKTIFELAQTLLYILPVLEKHFVKSYFNFTLVKSSGTLSVVDWCNWYQDQAHCLYCKQVINDHSSWSYKMIHRYR